EAVEPGALADPLEVLRVRVGDRLVEVHALALRRDARGRVERAGLERRERGHELDGRRGGEAAAEHPVLVDGGGGPPRPRGADGNGAGAVAERLYRDAARLGVLAAHVVARDRGERLLAQRLVVRESAPRRGGRRFRPGVRRRVTREIAGLKLDDRECG